MYDPNQAAQPTSGFPGASPYGPTGAYPGQPAPARNRRGLLIGLIAAIVVVVIAGGGITAFLLFGRSGGDGQADPTAAATNFLTAVYKDKDAAKAGKYVCASARDEGEITKKVKEVKDYAQKFNSDPQFSWDQPKVETSTKERATLSVTVKFATSDDRTAEQKLSIVAVNDDGWLVCEVKSV
jgi:flagellar basal body-associated protein FliL